MRKAYSWLVALGVALLAAFGVMDQGVTNRSGVRRARVDGVTFVIGSESGDVINVGLQFTEAGLDCIQAVACQVYLSDNDDGSTLAGTAPSAGMAIGTDGLLIENIANKSGMLISEADGDADIDIDEAAGDTWYLVVVLPSGVIVVSGAITFAA